MTGPALAIQLFLLVTFILFLATLLYIAIKKRKRLAISIPTSILFLALITITAIAYRSCEANKDKEARKFLGYYTLTKLDGQDCRHCLVRLTSDYRYTILEDGKDVGHGKWWLETAIDIPGMFLQLEAGPKQVMWSDERTIDYIDRRNK